MPTDNGKRTLNKKDITDEESNGVSVKEEVSASVQKKKARKLEFK